MTTEESRAGHTKPDTFQSTRIRPYVGPSWSDPASGAADDQPRQLPGQVPPSPWREPFRRGAAGAQAAVGDLLAWRRAPHTLTLAGTVAVTALVTFAVIYSAFNGSDEIPVHQARSPVELPDPNFPAIPAPSPTTSTPSSASPSASSKPPAASSSPSSPRPRPTTPKPSATKPPASKPTKEPPSAKTWSLRSVNYPDRYIRARDDGSVGLDKAIDDGVTFALEPGLADRGCYSFAARDGVYLRHASFQLRLAASDGSKEFKEDATFCKRPGAASGSVAWESYNYPGRFLRHRDFRLRLDRYEHSQLYRLDTSFRLTRPPG